MANNKARSAIQPRKLLLKLREIRSEICFCSTSRAECDSVFSKRPSCNSGCVIFAGNRGSSSNTRISWIADWFLS